MTLPLFEVDNVGVPLTSLVIKRTSVSAERLLAPDGDAIVSEIATLDVDGADELLAQPFDVVFVEVLDIPRAACWIEKASALSPRPIIVAIMAIELKGKDGFRLHNAGADALVDA